MPSPQQTALHLALLYQNLAGLSPNALKMIEGNTQQYFPGIQLDWQQAGASKQVTNPYNMVFTPSSKGFSTPQDAWGAALGQNAYTFTNEAEKSFGQNPLRLQQILGAVTAHEIGHMLGLGHSKSGLMSGRWNTTAPSGGFDKKQLSQIKKQLSRQLTIGGTP